MKSQTSLFSINLSSKLLIEKVYFETVQSSFTRRKKNSIHLHIYLSINCINARSVFKIRRENKNDDELNYCTWSIYYKTIDRRRRENNEKENFFTSWNLLCLYVYLSCFLPSAFPFRFIFVVILLIPVSIFFFFRKRGKM